MRILYYFQELSTAMFKWQYTHWIDELRRRGFVIDIVNPLSYKCPEEANEQLLLHMKKNKYDLFFTNVCYYKMLFIETIKSIKISGVPTLCFRCDNLVIPYNDEVLAPYFDLLWLTSIETKHIYDKWKCKSFFAPYAANPYTFSYTPSEIKRRAVFIGTPYGSRTVMINSFTNNDIPVDLYYSKTSKVHLPNNDDIRYNILSPNKYTVLMNRLRFKEGRKLLYGKIMNSYKKTSSLDYNNMLNQYPAVNPAELSAYYSSYALSIASTSAGNTDILKNPLKIINLRNFEIPMSGGIEFCKYNSELAEYFEDGREIVFYHDQSELVDKANYYLNSASDKHLLEMKMAARKRSESEHTWFNRFSIAFEILGLHEK